MHFAFTEQQIEFRDAVRWYLDRECTPAALRLAYDAPAARTPRWAALADMGVVGLTVPVESGGLGLGMVDLAPILEESGRVALPEPLVETVALAAPLLADLPHTDDPWSSRIATGAATVAVGVVGGAPVAGAYGADLLVLADLDPGGRRSGLHVVEPAGTGVEPIPSLDPTRRLGEVACELTDRTLVLAGEAGEAAWSALCDRASLSTAAQLLGLADRMIQLASGHARERQQFGRPIGSFQAVKHLLAGAQVALEFARPLVYAAAWAIDADEPGSSRTASAAKAAAAEAAMEAARVSLQVHGAIGYTWECDLHLFLKRTWALAEAWGSAAEHRSRVLRSLRQERSQDGRPCRPVGRLP